MNNDRQSALEWWTTCSQEILTKPSLTQVVLEVVEREFTASTAGQLAKAVTDRRRRQNGPAGLDQSGAYAQSTLSADTKAQFEPRGLVIRPAKAHRADQSIISTVGWTTEFLAKQDLENSRPLDPTAGAQATAMMEYVLDVEASADGSVRHSVPLEGVLYTLTSAHVTVDSKDVHIEVGDPASFTEQSYEVASRLSEVDSNAADSTAESDPLPALPHHRDVDAWGDKYKDWAAIGAVSGVEEDSIPSELRIDLEAELKEWAAASIELYIRDEADERTGPEVPELSPEITDEVIAKRANEFAAFDRDEPHERFGTRVMLDGERLLLGLYCRHDIDARREAAITEASE
jgi:hypothetical protein